MADFVKDGIIGNNHGIKKVGRPYIPLIETMAAKWRVPEVLISHQMRQESSFNPNAISRAGAVGIMQILPGTAREIAARHGLPEGPLSDPTINADLGLAYLTDLYAVAWNMIKDMFKQGLQEVFKKRIVRDLLGKAQAEINEVAYKLALIGYFAGPQRMKDILAGGEPTTGERKYIGGTSQYPGGVVEDFERTESWSQLKAPGAGKGFPWWMLLLAVGGVAVVYKQKKKNEK